MVRFGVFSTMESCLFEFGVRVIGDAVFFIDVAQFCFVNYCIEIIILV